MCREKRVVNRRIIVAPTSSEPDDKNTSIMSPRIWMQSSARFSPVVHDLMPVLTLLRTFHLSSLCLVGVDWLAFGCLNSGRASGPWACTGDIKFHLRNAKQAGF